MSPAAGWLQVSLILAGADSEQAESLLEDLGAVAITLLDAADQPILEPGPGATPLWPNVQVRGLFAADAPAQTVTDALRERFGDKAAIGAEWLADQAWERAWLAHFKPMSFGQRLWIRPSGFEVPAQAQAVVDLDPGLAFGTGTHPTTRLCLQWLDQAQLEQLRVLDYGCGSGILAVAALVLGAATAVATDIDPQAIESTRLNAERNRVAARLTAVLPDALAEADRYDLLLANILATPLIELAPKLIAFLRPRGQLVLSGLLVEQIDPVVSAYAGYIEFAPPQQIDGWACLSGRRLP